MYLSPDDEIYVEWLKAVEGFKVSPWAMCKIPLTPTGSPLCVKRGGGERKEEETGGGRREEGGGGGRREEEGGCEVNIDMTEVQWCVNLDSYYRCSSSQRAPARHSNAQYKRLSASHTHSTEQRQRQRQRQRQSLLS